MYSRYVLSIFLTIYISIKNRKIKEGLINKVADCAPPVFRERSINSMRNVAHNWLIGTMFPSIWFMYPILRFLCSLSNIEIITWRKKVKILLGNTYSICILSLNLSFTGLIYLVIRTFVIPY
ncbi:membrane protein [Aliivibrio wodanis]|uniref:Membrane protein n=1 Tax=Aliivibrio wodanis TaxID=80852 RepID=A0A090I7A8_9GAMM|nr:membrane protein [Aliivibrio wodanis]